MEEILAVTACIGGTTQSYKKKETIYFAGDQISRISIVLEGTVRLQKEDINGNLVLVDKLSEGDMFGEALVCAGVKKIHLSVWAESDAVILFLSYSKILTICPAACSFHSKLIQNMLKGLAVKLVNVNQKLEIMQKRSIREKLITYFESCVHKSGSKTFTIPLNRNDLADFIGVNRSALSRELGNMRDEGIIVFDGDIFTIN